MQALDSRLGQLAHRRTGLPEHAAVQDLEGKRVRARDLLVAAQTEEGDLARAQTKAEADVDQVRGRAERDQKRLDAGAVSSPKELESLQHEIVSLARRQGELEDAVLEVMERRESAQRRIGELTQEIDALEKELATTSERLDGLIAEIDAEVATVGEQRAQLAKALPEALMKLYEKSREQHGGVGAAALRQRRCEGCRLELNPTDIEAIRAAAEDTVLRCEECRRILVRTAESGL